MGIGDELMAAGQARKLHKSNGMPVLIVDRGGRPRSHELWAGLPYIIQRPGGKPCNRLVNGSGVRPYIAAKTPTRWHWRPFIPTPAEIRFTDAERAFAEPYRGMVMIEPNVKALGHDNKAWLPTRWVELTAGLRLPWVQCVNAPEQALPAHVLKVITPNFRLAAAVLAVSKAFVGTEGGLMHAAAAVGTPAVILWSEFIDPSITGYSTMTNLRHAGKSCGNRLACPGCRKSMEAISVHEVEQALLGVLK